jgi:hypothetical protein
MCKIPRGAGLGSTGRFGIILFIAGLTIVFSGCSNSNAEKVKLPAKGPSFEKGMRMPAAAEGGGGAEGTAKSFPAIEYDANGPMPQRGPADRPTAADHEAVAGRPGIGGPGGRPAAVVGSLALLEEDPTTARAGASHRREALLRRGSSDHSNPKEKEAPQVWHADGRRPAFARVYVGGGNSLELVSLQVSVSIEGPRARTLVDHIFRNPHDRQLEGTFEYPLPTGASPSYFAMFLGQTRDTVPQRFAARGEVASLPQVALARLMPAEVVKQISTADWGRLQEGRVVGKEKALETYEEIVRGRIDPALLEYAGGNTFSGRVFPILPKGYNRVLIAYEELLPVVQDHNVYRFPLPDCKLAELQFNLSANTAECKQPGRRADGKRPAHGRTQGSRLPGW